jgi:hypothetical protein
VILAGEIMPMSGSLTYTPLSFPLSVSELMAAFDAVERDAEQLVWDTDDVTFRRAPAPGAWSASECLDHLRATVHVYVSSMDAGLRRARPASGPSRPLAPGVLSRWFIRRLEPPVTLRVKARASVRPAAPRPREETWQAFVAANDVFRGFVRRCHGLDINRIRFANPFAPLRLTVATGLAAVVAHHRRHVWQAARALRAVSTSM